MRIRPEIDLFKKKEVKKRSRKLLWETHPDLSKQWDYNKNGDLTPKEITRWNKKEVYWICEQCGKPVLKKTYLITISKKNEIFCNQCKSLSTTHPEISKQWDYDKNGDLTPKKVIAGSNKKVWWKCSKNEKHRWKVSVRHRTRGSNCPYCVGQRVDKSNCLLTTHPAISKEWDYDKNGDLTPEKVTKGTHKKVWWKCPKCGESYDQVVKNKIFGHRCPYCSFPIKKVNKSKSLSTTHPAISKEWDYIKNGDLTPERVTMGSNRKVWWRCLECKGFYKQEISKRTLENNGCPYCKKKNEHECYKILQNYFSKWKIRRQKKIWNKYKNYNHKRYCDFWIEKNNIKIMLEYDGEFHFIEHWAERSRSLEQVQLIHDLDEQWCKENGVILYRIKYNEDKEKSIRKFYKKIQFLLVK